LIKKLLSFIIIFLLIVIVIIPIIGVSSHPDDTTPPITTITTDPPEPVYNGWYAPIVGVSLNATDNESGVNATYYQINNEGWVTYTHSFYLVECRIIDFQFYSVDNAGNVEEINQMEIKIDCYPPILNYTIDPPEPDGWNGWYVSNITITLNATDNESGVKYPPPDETINITEDGEIPVELWAIDNVGNEVIPHHGFMIYMDQTKPNIILEYELDGGNALKGWDLLFTAIATDDTSGMNKVEFYANGELQETVNGYGPTYQWVYHYPSFYSLNVRGLIRNKEITDEYVKFYSMIVIISGLGKEDLPLISAYAYDNAGNKEIDEILSPSPKVIISPGIYLFKNLTLPNNYTGFIGKSFIKAIFYV
jgi:hypothetical protein